uniref:Ig-like domain-containing protein n=1 Tax=Myotis myotis TaxID=51298 RepID=A0A7J7QXK5_MYOMY|nr:hypothetical protein mMyoMyo1_011269 [Myotis myotis]
MLGPQTTRSSVLTFTPRPWNHGTSLTCQVKLQGSLVATQRTIRLNVSYAPGNLTIGVSFRKDTAFKNLQTTSLSILEGEALRLLCVADSNPPAELSWFRGSPGLNATPLSSTAILELPRVGPAQEGEFTCQARHPLGSHSVSLSLTVVYPPQLLGPSCSWEDQGLHCSCSSRAQPAPSLRWRLGAGLLEGNHGNASHVVSSSSEGPWTNSSLSLKEGLSPDLRLSCEAWNVHGAQSASVLLLPGQGLLGAEATEKGVDQREGGAEGGGCAGTGGIAKTGPSISCRPPQKNILIDFRKGEGGRDRNINEERESLIGCLPHAPYREEMDPATWACALDQGWNRTGISWFTGGG